MKIKDFRKIIKLVSVDGLVKEFIIRKDGSVLAMAPGSTMLVKLKYNGINEVQDVAIENSEKFREVLSRFDDNAETVFKDNQFVMSYGGKDADIPRVNIDTITKSKEFPDLSFLITIPDVPLDKLKSAIKNKTSTLFVQYEFIIENGVLKVRVGNTETGTITEEIASVSTDKNMSSIFWINVPQVNNTLEVPPTINMGNKYPVRMDAITDEYSISYLMAPRAEQQ